MSVEIPENMEEVAMRQALLKTRGHDLSTEEVINTALLDALQAFVDQELDGRYDTVTWEEKDLVVTDLMGEEVARLAPADSDLVEKFKINADMVFFELEETARKAVGSR